MLLRRTMRVHPLQLKVLQAPEACLCMAHRAQSSSAAPLSLPAALNHTVVSQSIKQISRRLLTPCAAVQSNASTRAAAEGLTGTRSTIEPFSAPEPVSLDPHAALRAQNLHLRAQCAAELLSAVQPSRAPEPDNPGQYAALRARRQALRERRTDELISTVQPREPVSLGSYADLHSRNLTLRARRTAEPRSLHEPMTALVPPRSLNLQTGRTAQPRSFLEPSTALLPPRGLTVRTGRTAVAPSSSPQLMPSATAEPLSFREPSSILEPSDVAPTDSLQLDPAVAVERFSFQDPSALDSLISPPTAETFSFREHSPALSPTSARAPTSTVEPFSFLEATSTLPFTSNLLMTPLTSTRAGEITSQLRLTAVMSVVAAVHGCTGRSQHAPVCELSCPCVHPLAQQLLQSSLQAALTCS